MSVEEFAGKYIEAQQEAWKTGRFDALAELEDPDVVFHYPMGQDAVGCDAHKVYILTAREAVSDLHQEWEFLAGEGNLFALSYRASGILTRAIPGLPPAVGEKYATNYLWVLRLKDGTVVEAWINGSSGVTGK